MAVRFQGQASCRCKSVYVDSRLACCLMLNLSPCRAVAPAWLCSLIAAVFCSCLQTCSRKQCWPNILVLAAWIPMAADQSVDSNPSATHVEYASCHVPHSLPRRSCSVYIDFRTTALRQQVSRLNLSFNAEVTQCKMLLLVASTLPRTLLLGGELWFKSYSSH